MTHKMDQQLTFADSEFSNKRRQTRKEKFLGRMDMLFALANVVWVDQMLRAQG